MGIELHVCYFSQSGKRLLRFCSKRIGNAPVKTSGTDGRLTRSLSHPVPRFLLPTALGPHAYPDTRPGLPPCPTAAHSPALVSSSPTSVAPSPTHMSSSLTPVSSPTENAQHLQIR
jgi:hypothetical protein